MKKTESKPDLGTVVTRTEVASEHFDAAFGIWLVARGVTALLGRITVRSGWSPEEYAVASMVHARGVATNGDLARWLAASPTTTSSLLRRMEARGDVTRSPHPSDARSNLVRLTEAGRSTRDAIARDAARTHRELDQLFAEFGIDGATLGVVRAHVDALRAADGMSTSDAP